MTPATSGAATLPRHFRYDMPRTPEPEPQTELALACPPSPPRPKFKLKRRAVSNLNAPTQQFLASVAAADLPIPSIEEPEPEPEPSIRDAVMTDATLPAFFRLADPEDMSLLRAGRRPGRSDSFSPPKTPVPESVPSLSPKLYPDWSMDSACDDSSESSPECDSSRPSTARSTQTSASLFSRYSLVSDDLQFSSPKKEPLEPFPQMAAERQVPSIVAIPPMPPRSDTRSRKAPWTRAMDHHLWSTYMTYLQDPRVTPFRTGKTGLPPHGVCIRVAREAKRSWKGARSLPQAQAQPGEAESGNNTPTGEKLAAAFIQWPHTLAATRARLMDHCRTKSIPSHVRNTHCLSRSPTPYGRTAGRFRGRWSTPATSPSAFVPDMAVSLAVSTSEVMQPCGPLARLTGSASGSLAAAPPLPQPSQPASLPGWAAGLQQPEPIFPDRRLGSPFVAKSYGPSSSVETDDFPVLAGTETTRQTQSHSGTRRSLQSPVRISRGRANTVQQQQLQQKRRSRRSSIEPSRRTKRPSLASDLWMDPDPLAPKPIGPQDDLFFVSRSSRGSRVEAGPARFRPRALTAMVQPTPFVVGSSLAPPASGQPPRLGSPFSAANPSYSFPSRFSNPGGEAGQRPLADGGAVPPCVGNLAHRLAYVDQRLRDMRQHRRRRSDLPF